MEVILFIKRSAQSFLRTHAWRYTNELLAKNKFSMKREKLARSCLMFLGLFIKVLKIIRLQKCFNDLGDTFKSAIKAIEVHCLKPERTHLCNACNLQRRTSKRRLFFYLYNVE